MAGEGLLSQLTSDAVSIEPPNNSLEPTRTAGENADSNAH